MRISGGKRLTFLPIVLVVESLRNGCPSLHKSPVVQHLHQCAMDRPDPTATIPAQVRAQRLKGHQRSSSPLTRSSEALHKPRRRPQALRNGSRCSSNSQRPRAPLPHHPIRRHRLPNTRLCRAPAQATACPTLRAPSRNTRPRPRNRLSCNAPYRAPSVTTVSPTWSLRNPCCRRIRLCSNRLARCTARRRGASRNEACTNNDERGVYDCMIIGCQRRM